MPVGDVLKQWLAQFLECKQEEECAAAGAAAAGRHEFADPCPGEEIS
jgi:hypothetical protein